MGEYKLLTTQLIPTLARRLQVLESGIPTRSTLDLVISQSREPNEFFPSLDFLLKAVEILDQPGPSTSKNDLPVFGPYALSLGPNGLTPIVEILIRLGLLIEGNKSQYDIIQYQTMTESILALCQPMNHLVYHFRHTIPRVRWDPPGYRQFFDTLRLRENLESKLEASVKYSLLFMDDPTDLQFRWPMLFRDMKFWLLIHFLISCNSIRCCTGKVYLLPILAVQHRPKTWSPKIYVWVRMVLMVFQLF